MQLAMEEGERSTKTCKVTMAERETRIKTDVKQKKVKWQNVNKRNYEQKKRRSKKQM